MFCEIKFLPQRQPNYNPRWGVVFNQENGENHEGWKKVYDTGLYANLNNEIEEEWKRNRMTGKDKKIRDRFVDYLSERLECVYPGGHLICSGSSISKCGTIKADMDLCYALKTSEFASETPYRLDIEKYSETINRFMIDRIRVALSKYDEIKDLESIPAKVPIVKFKLNTKAVDPNSELDTDFEFDINCNCVAGVYNAHLLGGLVNFDGRFQKLAIIIKRWAKNVKLVDEEFKSRFNSYLIVLMIVHYLQCGVNPPVLPNLVALQPEDYDGTKEPWNLTTFVDSARLPAPENAMSVGALLCGFFRYYADFDFRKYGILIRDASIINLGDHGYFGGMLGSKIFIEEAYDGLTVAKNIKEEYDFEHIMNELKIAYHLTNPKHTDGKAKRPSLQPLLAREITPGVATRRIDYKRFLETLSYPK